VQNPPRSIITKMAVPIIGQNAMGAVMDVKNPQIWYWVIEKNPSASVVDLSHG
jgi:hypothetical protein